MFILKRFADLPFVLIQCTMELCKTVLPSTKALFDCKRKPVRSYSTFPLASSRYGSLFGNNKAIWVLPRVDHVASRAVPARVVYSRMPRTLFGSPAMH